MTDVTEQSPTTGNETRGAVWWRGGGIAVAVAVLALMQALTIVAARSTSVPLLVLDIVVAVGSLAAVPLLPVRPVAAGITLGVLAVLSPAATPTATCGAFAVAQSRPFRWAAEVAAVGAAAHILRGLWRPTDGLSFAWWVVLVLVAYATLVGWGAFVQARRALLASLRARAVRAESEQARRVAEARVLERTRIAREMHDVLAHRLSLLATYAGALEYRPDAPPERLSAAAGVVRDGVHQALEELREVITVLRDDSTAAAGPSAPQPTLADLPALVAENSAAGMRVALHADALDLASVPMAPARAAYRIVQEAMTNARRHAPGQPVDITVTGSPGAGLDIEVQNPVDRTGAPTSALGAGTGLVGLAERVQLLGGDLQQERTATRFRLAARLPWPS